MGEISQNSKLENQPNPLVAFVVDNPDLPVPNSVRLNLRRVLDENPKLVERLLYIQKLYTSASKENLSLGQVALENFISDIKAILEG
ncbi:MAG: hypothetical protein WC794_01800 [Candidatus Doudnabacteria bacterium]|jgi:hypothetical protein